MRIQEVSFLTILLILFNFLPAAAQRDEGVLIGAYYFGGWAGHNPNCSSWDKDAPTHATEKLEKQFSNREPLWGWRDDTDAIMKKQINLASKNGIDCFFFCWYWSDNKAKINEEAIAKNPTHDCIYRFMDAKNNGKMNFAMMIANHGGAEIKGKDNWISLIDYMSQHYFKHPRYLMFDGKPVIAVFSPKDMFPFIDDMRSEAEKNGFKGLYIISLGNHNDLNSDAFSWYNIREAEPGVKTERSYADYSKFIVKCWYDNPRLYPNVIAGWDQRPWDWKGNSLYFTGRTPQLFGEQLLKAYDFLRKCTLKHKMILIYAWNEMGEGGYIIPTKDDPKGKYLKEIRNIKKKHK